MSFVIVSKTGCSHLVVWDGESLASRAIPSDCTTVRTCVSLPLVLCNNRSPMWSSRWCYEEKQGVCST